MHKKIFSLGLFTIFNTSTFTPESKNFNTAQAAYLCPSFNKNQNPEPIVHGLPRSQFEALKKAHPNFTTNILRAMNMPEWALEATINAGYNRIKSSLDQLTEEQALLFSKLENAKGESLREIAQRYEQLNILLEECLERFKSKQAQVL